MTVDGQDMDLFHDAFERAKKAGGGKPQLIIAKTLIGKGIPEVAGTQKAHGEGVAKFADEARKNLGLPAEHFFVSPEVKSYFAEHKKTLDAAYDTWMWAVLTRRRGDVRRLLRCGRSRSSASHAETRAANGVAFEGRLPLRSRRSAASSAFVTSASNFTRRIVSTDA